MTKEIMHRALLIEEKFANAQVSTGDTHQISSLYNKNANGIFELSRRVQTSESGERKFLHTMSFYKDDGVVRRATLENGEVVGVEGFGGENTPESMKRKAKGLFHTLRRSEFSPIKPVKPIGY